MGWTAPGIVWHQGLYSLSGKTSYRKISWSLEAARFGFKLFQSLWNLAGTSAALLPRCLSNFRAIRPLQHPISRLRDFTRFGDKTSYRLVNRGPGTCRISGGIQMSGTQCTTYIFFDHCHLGYLNLTIHSPNEICYDHVVKSHKKSLFIQLPSGYKMIKSHSQHTVKSLI